MQHVLDFERPLLELERKIEELRQLQRGNMDFSAEISLLEAKAVRLLDEIFADLDPWQVVQLSRHPERPTTLEYIREIFDEFVELHGDRLYSDDQAIIGGLARLDGRALMLLGHQKGRSTKENMRRNFGMARPEGYRKAQRLMKLAARSDLPVVTFIDTPGAYPGLGAEQRGQAEAIATSLEIMATLPIPMIGVVIGEGGSGGALALGVTNRILMLEYSTYSVITPEGCASILWRDAAKAPRAAEAMRMAAREVHRMGVADEVVTEPKGGAHRNPAEAAARLAESLRRHLDELSALGPDELLEQRYQKFRVMGEYRE